MLGMHGTVYANYAVDHVDLLLEFGVQFGDRVTSKLEAFHLRSRDGWSRVLGCSSIASNDHPSVEIRSRGVDRADLPLCENSLNHYDH
jgi:thiamine pyrophosphate-dependent acetolactate synthase large subunit-like protein